MQRFVRNYNQFKKMIMKKNTLYLLFGLFILLFTNCTKDYVTESYSFYKPLYKTKTEVQAQIANSPITEIKNPGKIFLKDDYLYLVDINKGIHIINVANPISPKQVSFVQIPGCLDIAVRGNNLYADCYSDLVNIDITNPISIQVKQFLHGVFPHRIYSGGYLDTNRIIVDWVRVDTIVKRENVENFQRNIRNSGWAFSSLSSASLRSGGTSNGQGGSMARFGLYNDRMYTVSNSDLKVFNTTNPTFINYIKAVALNRGDIETVFPYKDKLFIGGQSGMFIYSVTNPDNPNYLSQFAHARACDPVIADDDFAYVTLHSGNFCAGFQNQLDIVDITSIQAPKLFKTYPLTEPKGLAKDVNTLLICDGKDGLKIFNAANKSNLIMQSHIKDMNTYDVIANNGTAIVSATRGLYFVDYTNPSNAKILSSITIQNK